VVEQVLANGRRVHLLSEKEIIKYLRRINCPFCGGSMYIMKECWKSVVFVCKNCNFPLRSHALYISSRVTEDMRTVEEVLSKPIQEAVVSYEKELEKEIENIPRRLKKIIKILKLHYKRQSTF
jgi:transcription elongation factor Elf1